MAVDYYDSENIEDGRLSFRQAIDIVSFSDSHSELVIHRTLQTELSSDEGDEGTAMMYGIARREPLVQQLGRIQTP